MTIKQKLKKFVAGTVIAAALLCGVQNHAIGQSVELMKSNENTTLDLKVTSEIAPKINLFLRNRTTIDYNNQVSNFGLADLSYNLIDGVDVVAEAQLISDVGVTPRLGLQYFRKFGDFNVYAMGTVSAKKNPDGELLLNLRYAPNLTDNIKGVVNLENITNVGERGHNFSTQRIRLGLGVEKLEFGLATDLVENNSGVSYNAGVYGKINF